MGKGGDSTDAEQQASGSSPGDLLEEARFAPFQGDNFNVAEFTSKVLGGSHITASAQSDQLRDGVQTLETALSAEVVARNKELLQHVRRMLDAENSVRDVVLSVDSLQSAVRRIRAEVVGPYEQIKHKTLQLRNIHATVDTLRHVIHRLKLAQKLRAQLAVDLAKAAKLITDIRHVDAEVDLSSIEAVAVDADFVEAARKSVHEQAELHLAAHRAGHLVERLVAGEGGHLRYDTGATDPRLPAAVQAPHERSGLTPAQYSLWLDTHGPLECVRSVAGALAAAPAGAVAAAGGEAVDALAAMKRLCAAAGVAVGP
ncbi:Conserved oligomeric Golgi complex subunit 5 [Tetrabaena socialis]|uniref:Conserved oligomeric Golgi complex subunit 5 n=1 Tax=Tetrabaena socialis TaxID=47790 RepID=A0A2J7ZUK6_9CHLO|nr:Conserved oligomeric Golgi complex subunit 5 [Tetrabaena socialis]|eukprot:PNH03954.1 Conserved oligomeric Golgi complex subunit 5 [Tetrabaena socialis]